MDVITISTPGWLTHLIESYEKEVRESENITLLTNVGRHYVWKWCERLGLNKHGLPGQTCHLLERYLTKTLFKKLNTESDNEEVESYMRDIRGKIKIITGCCILLSVKMFQREDEKKIQNMIFKHKYATKDIVRTEAKVFQALDFYIPSRTTVEIAHLLAAEIKVTNQVFKEIDHVVNQAELHMPNVIDKVQWVANYDGSAMICRLHLAAGGVAAAAYYVSQYTTDPAVPLGQLTRASAIYITTIARAILHIAELGPEEHED